MNRIPHGSCLATEGIRSSSSLARSPEDLLHEDEACDRARMRSRRGAGIEASGEAPLVEPAPDRRPFRVCMGMLSTTGGSSIVARELAQGLAGHGFETRCLHLDARHRSAGTNLLLDAGQDDAVARLLDVSPALAGANDLAGDVLRAHDQWPFDVFHLHNLQVFGQPAMVLEALRAVPYVVTCHGSDVLDERLMDRNREVAALILQRARAVTCVSAHLAETLRRKVPELRHVHVIHNFLREAWRGKQAVQAHAGAPRLLHVSSLREVKRPELLLDVVADVRRSRPDTRLSIVTTEAGLRRLHSLAQGRHATLGIDAYDGEADPQALHREAMRANALLLTSRFEGFGLVVLEALAYGLPVVAPRVGALPEVLGEDWPFLVEDGSRQALAQACLHALSDGACDPAAMARVASRFDGCEQIAQYASLYRHVVHGGARVEP